MKLTLNPADKKGTIRKEIYSNFSEHLGRCIYDGIFVGKDSDIPNIEGFRKDVVEAFRAIKLPVLRWPGGCFADEYHWKDGIGDLSSRKKMVNTNWGGVVEDNSFGTHEFLRFCELVGCEPYISGNVGSGTVEELSQWIEYITFDGVSPMAELRRKNGRDKPWRLKYLGIGNENWGCGGNMTADYYCDNYLRYASFCREFSGNHLYRIACGPNSSDYGWTDTIMRRLTVNNWIVNGISLHHYTIPGDTWEHKGSATEFSGEEYYTTIKHTLFMEELLTRHSGIMDRYDPEKRIGLIVDEWGIWCDVEPGTNPGFLYQQNTMRDAVVAAINLNLFNNHCDRVHMANIAQAVNVLQAILLTEGNVTVKTPTYHVFDLYKEHQDAELIYSHIENEKAHGDIDCVTSSASIAANGDITVTLSNCSLDKALAIEAATAFGGISSAAGRVLSGEVHAHNDFKNPDNVVIKPLEVTVKDGKACFTLPACSAAAITIKL